jgi:methionine sulfoxide reductase heme-binding subunit
MRVPWRDRRGKFLPFKAAVLIAVCVPGLVSAWWWTQGELGARPIIEMIHNTGLWTIRFLLISLAVTPLRAALDWPRLLLVRRMVGVTAMVYGLLHLTLYALDQKWALVVVASEIVHRFYLTIGCIALLTLIALGATSTDAATRWMGRWWKRLHRLAYPAAMLAVLHYFIQSKANVSEPVFVAGLYVWLMLWRMIPVRWQRRVAVYPVLAMLAGCAAAGIEFAWYDIATHINAWRVLGANETLAYGPRPAHLVALAALGLALLIFGRRFAAVPPAWLRAIPLRPFMTP